jgi:ATP-dependent protease HslVU (ClpYQ) peptidase subunit
MTCIVGLETDDGVWLGAESAGTGGNNITIRKDEKIFFNGQFLISGTSSFRMLQLLRYKLQPPIQSSGSDDLRFLCTDFIDSVKKCFSENGFGKMPDKDNNSGGTFLFAYNAKLYTVFEDFQISHSVQNFAACGCGRDFALGSMYTSRSWDDSEARIKLALESASEFSTGCAPPFHILKQSK